MVVELILTTLVTKAAEHYAQKGLTWFDGQTKQLAQEAANGDDAARERVGQRLHDILRSAPPPTNGLGQ